MHEVRSLAVGTRAAVEQARRDARALAATLGFGREDREAIALATSELATNLVRHARAGAISLSAVEGPGGPGIQIVSRDLGPGIADLAWARRDGCGSGGGLGSGLPAVWRLMDAVEITSSATGTTVVARKWLRR